MTRKSELWEEIFDQYLQKMELSDFRMPSHINSRLAAWNPKEKSLRWHKSFLLLAASTLTDKQIATYQSFGNVSVGSPIEITFVGRMQDAQGIRINIDYLLSLFEIDFLDNSFKKRKFPTKIYEVGAGFGRTCHAMLATFSKIESYRIIDFPEMLTLAESYLARVLSKTLFQKIEFVDVEKLEHDHDQWELGIQIDGLQEMEKGIIDYYIDKVFAKSKYFFSSNPIAKYLPEDAGLDEVPNNRLQTVLQLGRSRSIVNIWNDNELFEPRLQHIKQYCPPKFRTLHSQPQKLFPHFEMSLYSRD